MTHISLAVFGFDRSAQLSIAAGDVGDITQDRINILYTRAGEITKIAERVGSACSVSFLLGKGEALMLGIPVTEPEQASGRTGLCVIFVVYVSRRRKVSPYMLVQMLASIELAIAITCSGTYTNPIMTATSLTQLLQRHNYDPALETVGQVVDSLARLYNSMLTSKSSRTYNRIPLFSRPMEPRGFTLNTRNLDPYYQVCMHAADRSRISRKIQVCYYLPFSSHMIGRQLYNSSSNVHLFLDRGIVVGHSFEQNIDLSFIETKGF